MIKRTADLVNDKKLKELQIFVMNQRNGMRIVYLEA
jgi:hypothetical protein